MEIGGRQGDIGKRQPEWLGGAAGALHTLQITLYGDCKQTGSDYTRRIGKGEKMCTKKGRREKFNHHRGEQSGGEMEKQMTVRHCPAEEEKSARICCLL